MRSNRSIYKVSTHLTSFLFLAAFLTAGFSSNNKRIQVSADSNRTPSPKNRQNQQSGSSDSNLIASTAADDVPAAPSANPINEISRTSLDAGFEDFKATAYCLKGRTAIGSEAREGIIAADPRILPLGSVVHIRAGRYSGTYVVVDTGGRIRGKVIDIYVNDRHEAIQFGRRAVKLKIIGRTNPSGLRSKPTE